jgi:UDP-N-acetylmuramate dehydrogenase
MSINIEENKNLAELTTIEIGGISKYFVKVEKSADLVEVIKYCKDNSIKYYILGGGSNVLFIGDRFDGMVINISIKDLVVDGDQITCGAGCVLDDVVLNSVEAGLSGLEWATLIPGTSGGAIYGNAGAYGGSISDNLEMVEVYDDGEVKRWTKEDCDLGYRKSIFKTGGSKAIILSAIFKLEPTSKTELASKRNEIKSTRDKKFGDIKSAGSVFKGIKLGSEGVKEFQIRFPELPDEFIEFDEIPAGWLIDQCGLKGHKIGGAQIYDKHAGIIINIGGATAENVLELIKFAKEKVKQKFNLLLEEEIEIIN